VKLDINKIYCGACEDVMRDIDSDTSKSIVNS